MKGFRFVMLLCSIIFFACSGKKIKEKVNKVSETAGEVIGEAAKGVSRGVENAFEITIVKKDTISLNALSFGKVILYSDSSANDNRLSVYIIFNKDFNRNVWLKVFDKAGLELGRSKVLLTGKRDQAIYTDFVFDAKTNIDRDCTIIME